MIWDLLEDGLRATDGRGALPLYLMMESRYLMAWCALLVANNAALS